MLNKAMEDILAEAREIYDKTMCVSGCCGDFEGALKHIGRAVTTLVQETVDKTSGGGAQAH